MRETLPTVALAKPGVGARTPTADMRKLLSYIVSLRDALTTMAENTTCHATAEYAKRLSVGASTVIRLSDVYLDTLDRLPKAGGVDA